MKNIKYREVCFSLALLLSMVNPISGLDLQEESRMQAQNRKENREQIWEAVEQNSYLLDCVVKLSYSRA